MKNVKCKDYAIFRVNYYADRDKSGVINITDTKVLRQHHERVKTFHDFCWKLIEKLTGKPMSFWIYEFAMHETRSCALEYIWEHHGIMTADQTDGIMLFMVPKEQTELIEWIKSNVKNPFTMPKKTDIRVFDHFYMGGVGMKFPTYKRDEAYEFKNKYYPTGFPKQ